MSALAGIAYALLAIDYMGRASRPDTASNRTLPLTGVPERRRGGLGDLFTDPNAAMELSPTLRRGPARARIENVNGLDARVKRIKRLIKEGARDPAVRKLAIEILAARGGHGGWAVREKDWKGEASAVFNWVRRNMRYTRDHVVVDTYVHPARTLFDRKPGVGAAGDCDDFSIVIGSLLAAVGHRVKLRVVAARNGDSMSDPGWNHIYVLIGLPSGGAIAGGDVQWMALDASVDRPAGWQVPQDRIAKHRDFEVEL